MGENNFLWESLQNGNERALDKIYNIFWDRLYSFAFKLTSDKELSEQIIQDIFVDLWMQRASRKIIELENYLFTSVKYKVFKNYKNQKFHTEFLDEKFEYFIQENNDEDYTDVVEKINQSIDKLPKTRRQIFLMNKINDISIGQIAFDLNISKQTVKNQLVMAKKQLKSDLTHLLFMVLMLLFFA